MSERERRENAIQSGRRAFYAGVSVDACPLRARDSRLAWAIAWRKAEASTRSAKERLQRQLVDRKANTCASEGEDEIIDHCNGCGGEWPAQEDDVCPKCKPGPGLIRTFNERQAERFRTGERWTDPEPGED